MPTRDQQHHATIQQVADAIDRSVPTVWRRIRTAGVPTFRDPASGRTLIRTVDIAQLDAPVQIHHDAPVSIDIPDAA